MALIPFPAQQQPSGGRKNAVSLIFLGTQRRHVSAATAGHMPGTCMGRFLITMGARFSGVCCSFHLVQCSADYREDNEEARLKREHFWCHIVTNC